MSYVSLEEKLKGTSQIKATVEVLHSFDLTWGDVKPDNVLIDGHSDAWVIDFGCNCTEGWVDPKLMETKAGDLQGLQKLIEFLRV